TCPTHPRACQQCSHHPQEKVASVVPRFRSDDQYQRHFQHHLQATRKRRLQHFWHTSRTDYGASDKLYFPQSQPDVWQSLPPGWLPVQPSPEWLLMRCHVAASYFDPMSCLYYWYYLTDNLCSAD